MIIKPALLLITTTIAIAVGQTQNNGYYGKYLGPLTQYHHGVSGEVYVVDARTLHIRDFTYDGEGPAAYFYVGNSKAPGTGGIRIRDETGSAGVLKRYNKKHITVTLPEGKSLSQMKWFSVWCDEFSVNFGHINIPRGLEYPKPQKIGSLNGVHAVSSDSIVVVDAQTLLIPSFSYDGEAPDAKFWVGRGAKPTPQGIRVPDENGKITPLRKYERKTIVLTLPGDLTVYDIDYFGVWCEAFTVDFGHVKVPQGLLVPPSLKMLGVSPQKRSLELSSVQQTNGNFGFIRQDPSIFGGINDVIQPTTYRPFQRLIQPSVNQQVQQVINQQPVLQQQRQAQLTEHQQRQAQQYPQEFNYHPYQILQQAQSQFNQPQQPVYQQDQQIYPEMVLSLQPPPIYQPHSIIYDSRLLNQPQAIYQNLQNIDNEPTVQILPSVAVHTQSPYKPVQQAYQPQVTTYQPQQTTYQPLQTTQPQPTTYHPIQTFQSQPIAYQPIQTTYQPQSTTYQPQFNNYQQQPTTYQPFPTYQPQPTTYQPLYQPNNYLERRSFNAQSNYNNQPNSFQNLSFNQNPLLRQQG